MGVDEAWSRELMASLADYQFEYRGLKMGKGTDYAVTKAEGLEDLNARVADEALPRADGDIQGLHTAAGKSLGLEVRVRGAKDSQDLRDKVQALHTAFQHGDTADPFYWREPGFIDERFMWGRPVGRAQVRDARSAFQPGVMVRIKAADPRIYADVQQNKNLVVYSASGGGMDFDEEEYPKEFAADASSLVIANNRGNTKAWPLLRFYGPISGTVTEVTITNSTAGIASVFTTTILTGQILSADMRRIVTAVPGDDPYVALDGSNRYGDWNLPREPFYLLPGDNELRFEVTGGTSTDALCVVTYRDTWL